jgi:hypothetical protein
MFGFLRRKKQDVTANVAAAEPATKLNIASDVTELIGRLAAPGGLEAPRMRLQRLNRHS